MDSIRESCNAHIVGQVDDDVLLFTWDGKTDRTKVNINPLYQIKIALKILYHIK